MKNRTALFLFDLKKELQSLMLWAATLLFAILLTAGQMTYIQHFRLQNETDYEQIRIRRVTDVSIPLDGNDRIMFYAGRIKRILDLASMVPDSGAEAIIHDLTALLAQKDDLKLPDIMETAGILKNKYEALHRFTDYTFRNEYIYSRFKEVDFESLRNYIDSTGVSFQRAFSRQFSQMAAMMACIAFSIYFSFLFASELNGSTADTLHIVRLGGISTCLIKYLAGLAACCISAASVTLLIFSLVAFCNPGTGLAMLADLFQSLLVYTVPVILFISSVSVMLSFLAKSCLLGLPAGLAVIFLSSVALNGNGEQNLFLSPLVMSSLPFYAPLPPSLHRQLWESRLCWICLSVLILFVSGCLWNTQNSDGRKKRRRHPSAPVKHIPPSAKRKPGFLLYNARISLAPAALLGSAAFLTAPLFLNHFTFISEIGPAILSGTGWAAILLFSRLLSLEYAGETYETLFLTRVGKLKLVLARCLVPGCMLLGTEMLLYLLSLYKITDCNSVTFTVCFLQSLLAFFTSTLFWGTFSMCLSALFQKTWLGLCVSAFFHLLMLSAAETDSVLNIYFYKVYYSLAGKSDLTLISSSAIYGIISLLIIIFTSRILENRLKIKAFSGSCL